MGDTLTQVVREKRLRQTRIVLFEQRQLVWIGQQEVTDELWVIFSPHREWGCTTWVG